MTDSEDFNEGGMIDLDGWKWEKVRVPVKNWIFDVKVLDVCIDTISTISLDDIIMIELNFSGKEEKLWQLEKFVAKYNLFHIFTLLNIKSWAQTRSIPCGVKFQWTLKKRCISYYFHMVFGLFILKLFSGRS